MRAVAALLAGAALAVSPARGAAQQNCAVTVAAQRWPSPLDRRIGLRARDVSLREALDRVAAAARFRVSYSAEFLPLDRRVCLSADSVVAGDALAELLVGVNVSTLVTSADQVVIAPSRPAAAPRESVQTLERVVVTGSATGSAQRALSVALDVVDRKQMERQSSGTLSSTFDGNVAGVWLWEQSPSSLLARYGSIRGASSFGLSYPKVYIDGIEVANPLLLTDLDPASLDRIEVIRGPQGAALYGADAISGVVNIITRHEGLQAGASRTEATSRVGFSQTAFAENAALAQSHSVNWRAGSSMRSGSLGASFNTLGGYVPDAFSRDVKINGGFRVVTSTASITGTGRVLSKRAAAGENPLVLAFLPPAAGSMTASRNRGGATFESDEDSVRRVALSSSPTQKVGQYTFGLTSTLLNGTKWVPSFSVGVDGYQLKDVSSELGIVPSALDSALISAEGSAYRVTFRTSMVGQFDVAPRQALTLTFAAEHSQLQEAIRSTLPLSSGAQTRDTNFLGNSGLVAQANYAINDAVFLTAGGRIERSDGYVRNGQVVGLPMLGAAVVRDVGGLTVKGRAAYGIGVRPARSPVDVHRMRTSEGALDPERQSGVEVGADVFVDRKFALHLTYFDQRASGLIQQVAISSESMKSSSGSGPGGRIINYLPQNVGEITNRGWEVESSYDVGYFSLAGAFTSVDSRVQRIATNYAGDLRPGDRMLAVPTGTASLTATWKLFGWNAGMSASRAFDWVNYDRLKLIEDYTSCDSCFAQTISGPTLHRYWMNYDGVTRLRATLARELSRGIGLRVTADNLTNAQRGEPDNITVLPGRTLLLGLSAKIR
jgi:iron complex outermembrane receptor protein